MSMNCVHLRLYIDGTLSHTGGITVATRLEDGVCHIGASYCSPLDQFVRRDGVRRAVGRTYSQFAYSFSGPEEVPDVWETIWDDLSSDVVEWIDYQMERRWTKALVWMFLDDPGVYNMSFRDKDGTVVWERDILVGVWGDEDGDEEVL